MNTKEHSKTLFVGVDVHKGTHTAVGLSPLGEKMFEITIGNKKEDFNLLLTRSMETAEKNKLSPHFGLEDVRSYGERLSNFLLEEGAPVVAVPPVLVDRSRQKTTHPEKTDSLDARAAAEVMIKKIDKLPAHTLTEEYQKAKHIQEISKEREWLVKERARTKNNFHSLLYRIHNCDYKEKFKDPFSKKALKYWKENMPKDTNAFLVKRAQRAINRLMSLREEIKEIEEEMTELIKKGGYTLETLSGCGSVIAAEIIGEIKDIKRFRSPSALAKYAGCAPIERSSGKTIRHKKTRSGNRRLNRAFYRSALCQISKSGNDVAKEYVKKKISEGKTKQQALVCLRRQIVNIVWNMMKKKEEYRIPDTF